MDIEATRDRLAEDFAWLCLLAKLQTPEEVQRFALAEWERAKAWIASNSDAPGSFVWCCDQYEGLEPDAVRRAIREKKL